MPDRATGAAESPLPVAYDPSWPELFAAEAATIATAPGVRLNGPVEHIGSTAVPGLLAKPIIDMMAPVASLDDARDAAAGLTALGYRPRPHRVDAVLYVRPPRFGVHLTVAGSELWCERLAFRDALRSDDGLAAEYTALKRQLVDAAGGAVYDSADKREFVRTALTRVGHELRDGLHDPSRGN